MCYADVVSVRNVSSIKCLTLYLASSKTLVSCAGGIRKEAARSVGGRAAVRGPAVAVSPSPATHAILTGLKAGESEFQTLY